MKQILILFFFLLIFVDFYNGLSDKYIREKYAIWKREILKTPSNVPNSPLYLPSNTSESYLNFKQSLMDITKQKLKFLTGRSQFQMKLNTQASSSAAAKNIRNGFDAPESTVYPTTSSSEPSEYQDVIYLPPTLDYRDFGFVTEVQDQGFNCGSCYAFAANCALEGQIAKYYGKLVTLSEQNIVDCSRPYGNKGCENGYMEASFKYTKFNPGLANDSSYPYYGVNEVCQYTPDMNSAEISGYTFVQGDEANLKEKLVQVGPLAIAIKSNLNSFYYYDSGIYDDENCYGIVDHAVCLIGYGTDNTTNPPTNYWIIKNSWSTDWGENGYIRMKMGSNLCGINKYVVYPNI